MNKYQIFIRSSFACCFFVLEQVYVLNYMNRFSNIKINPGFLGLAHFSCGIRLEWLVMGAMKELTKGRKSRELSFYSLSKEGEGQDVEIHQH